MTPPQLIPGDALAELTDRSDRRHRQLAQTGYFPAPANGEYELQPTITGLFNYYRERAKVADPLTKARLEKLQVESRLLEITESARLGELAPVKEMAQRVSAGLQSIRATILAGDLDADLKDDICRATEEAYRAGFAGPAIPCGGTCRPRSAPVSRRWRGNGCILKAHPKRDGQRRVKKVAKKVWLLSPPSPPTTSRTIRSMLAKPSRSSTTPRNCWSRQRIRWTVRVDGVSRVKRGEPIADPSGVAG